MWSDPLQRPPRSAESTTLSTCTKLRVSFVSSAYTHGLASSFLEGCNVLTAAVSTPSNASGHSLLLLWGPEASGLFNRWLAVGGLWTFVALHGSLGLVGFMLKQLMPLGSRGQSTIDRESALKQNPLSTEERSSISLSSRASSSVGQAGFTLTVRVFGNQHLFQGGYLALGPANGSALGLPGSPLDGSGLR